MAVGDAHVFSSFLIPVLTQLFFPKPPTTFLTFFSRGERRKYAGKKVGLNRVSNSQPPGHESDVLTTEPRGFLQVKLEPRTSSFGVLICSTEPCRASIEHLAGFHPFSRNPFPNDKLWTRPKLEEFADDNFIFDKKFESFPNG